MDNKKKILKKYKLLLSLSSLLLLCALAHKREKETKIKILETAKDHLIAEYDNTPIYMGDKDYLKNIDLEECIKILDQRDSTDNPNCKIYDSYKILNVFEQKDIIDMLIEYEKLYPTVWDRTRNSMKNEWILHNIGYYFNYQRDRTTDVDLNNDDENVYKLSI